MTEQVNWKEDDIRDIVLTEPMMRLRLIRAKETILMASRGSFKTTQGISLYVADCTYELPRCSGIICGPSFEHLGDNTLNPLFNSLTRYGLIEGIHFVIGQPPPKSWPKPYIRIPSKKFDHIISWHNGSNQYLISMMKKGSANGISCQYGVFDEAKFLDPDELKEIVFPAFRGNEVVNDADGKEVKFKDHPLYLSKFFASDKLADIGQIQWLLDYREKNNFELFDIIITLQLELNRLSLEYNDAGINKRYQLKPQIEALEARLSILRKNTVCYMESSAKDSVQLLGEPWLQDKKDNSTSYVFKVAYGNEDPDRPEVGFYPDFEKSKHTYVHDRDYNPDEPLIIGADYQHSVAPICVCQISKLEAIGQKTESLNYIDQLYALAPDGLEEVVQEFIERYKHHRNRTIYYVFDQTATGKRVNADAYYKIVCDALQDPRHGWFVHQVHTGKQPGHYQKYTDTKAWLKNEMKDKMAIFINAEKCPNLIISIERSPAKSNRKGLTEKDKKYEDTEKHPQLDQSKTTHFSDVFDMINHAVLKLKRITFVGGSGFGGGAR